VTVNVVPGSGSVTISSVAVSPSSPSRSRARHASHLKSADNVYISTTCEVSVTLTNVFDRPCHRHSGNSNTAGALSVPLSGAYGAIKLFDETSVASTTSLVTGTNPYGLYTIANHGIELELRSHAHG